MNVQISVEKSAKFKPEYIFVISGLGGSYLGGSSVTT